MSKLDKLIAELCPDGVEWKTLGEVARFRRGSFPQPYGKDEWYGGDEAMPFVQVVDVGEDLRLVQNTKHKISKLAQPKSVFVKKGTVIVTLQGSIGRVAITQYDCYVDRTLAIFESFQLNINRKYFTYQLAAKFEIEKKQARGSTIKTITKAEFTKFLIPLPPLPIQEEIVRILDNFTELTAELTAELTDRKKQYEYYRDSLLTFGDEVEWKTLGETTRIFSASRVHKNEWTTLGVPFYRSSDVISKFNGVENSRGKAFISNELYKALSSKSGKIKKNDILITGGGTIGIPYIVPTDEPLYVKDADLLCIQKSQTLNSRFLYHYFLTTKFRLYLDKITHNASIAHYTISQIANTPVPIPPLAEQERIVSILDKFDTLTTSISEGLPKEIELRKKQYEYYRDKLLTFKKLQMNTDERK